MKTLDEVIYWYENRKSLLVGKATREEMEEDILYYLKKYRDNFETRNDQIERYQKAAKDCEEILTDYVALKQYWAEQQENPALTWEELRQMEGKPVWVEYINGGKRVDAEWIIIKKVKETYIENTSGRFQADSRGWSWHAYRKERE